jgi:short-subunit dehydrogenase
MKIMAGQTVLITGATGGLGTHITNAFAEKGVNLSLIAFPGMELDALREGVERKGAKVMTVVADVRDAAQQKSFFEETRRKFGAVDILVNNAGVEFTSVYHELPEQTMLDILRVNLEAPMVLSRLVLPEMLRRGSGHVVNISSLAGKSGPAFQEPYAASKAGLNAFTASLRASYRGTGVSASVICPGFVEAGIYAKLKEKTGCVAPWMLGTSQPEAVVRAVMRAVEKDLPEVIVNSLPVKPLFATSVLFPRLGEFLVRQTGAHEFFRKVAAAQKNGKT